MCNNAQIVEGVLQGQPTEGALMACAMKVCLQLPIINITWLSCVDIPLTLDLAAIYQLYVHLFYGAFIVI